MNSYFFKIFVQELPMLLKAFNFVGIWAKENRR